MKKEILYILFYNIVFLFFAVTVRFIESNSASILYMLLLLLISDLFFIRWIRKVSEKQKETISNMEESHKTLVEKERLSSLGQLIGGIAHNLKTPIMSISGGLEGISDLIKEYDESIDDQTVTNADHHEIAGDMKEWINKIKPYLSYMTEIIDAVKNQAVSMNSTFSGEFLAREFILRTELLMKEELNRRGSKLNLNININEETKIFGELNAIVQVLDNLIINSMDAYGDKGGDINLKIYESDKKIFIEVEDFAGGIKQTIVDKIFKEMITTKGKKGTGLGLYICYSTICGNFKGNMRVESTEGVGTKFFIELNKA